MLKYDKGLKGKIYRSDHIHQKTVTNTRLSLWACGYISHIHSGIKYVKVHEGERLCGNYTGSYSATASPDRPPSISSLSSSLYFYFNIPVYRSLYNVYTHPYNPCSEALLEHMTLGDLARSPLATTQTPIAAL